MLQRHFGLGKDESGYCLRSVLPIGEQRKAQITTYFPPDIGAGLKREDFSDVLIFRSVQKHLGVRLDVAHVTVRAEIADEAVAADLGIDAGQPGARPSRCSTSRRTSAASSSPLPATPPTSSASPTTRPTTCPEARRRGIF